MSSISAQPFQLPKATLLQFSALEMLFQDAASWGLADLCAENQPLLPALLWLLVSC